MTCIVGIVTEDGVILGADTLWAAGLYWAETSAVPKVFTIELCSGEKIGIGFAGQPRVMQILIHCVDWLNLGSWPQHGSEQAWIVSAAIPAMRRALDEHGAKPDDDSESVEAQFLFAVNGRLFEIQSKWQVFEGVNRYGAIGSGGPYALGSLATVGIGEPKSRVLAALEAAARFTPNVAPPFTVINVPCL